MENNKKHYFVKNFGNGSIFNSVEEIIEEAKIEKIPLKNLKVKIAKELKINIDAEDIVERAFDNLDSRDYLEYTNYVSKEKMEELQNFLNAWCGSIYTNHYRLGEKIDILGGELK